MIGNFNKKNHFKDFSHFSLKRKKKCNIARNARKLKKKNHFKEFPYVSVKRKK